jgi:glutathione synthase/RimK-type ligase-like ATP-grasp enzyme
MLYLLPYKPYSKSARDLASLLGAYYIRDPEASKNMVSNFEGKILNWGNSKSLINGYWINHPDCIAISNNKLLAFQKLKEHNVSIPEFTVSIQEAAAWIDNGHLVLARQQLSGHSGAGIVLCPDNESLVAAPLYVKYVKKAAEFRVHVAFGEVVDEQHKRRISNFQGEFSSKVRSHSNGWVYCRDGVLRCSRREDLARGAVSALALDFGAVDIIYNKKTDTYYVLEVNTAPGLEGETLFTYFNTFYSYLNHD